jgi:hypothetical protein
MVGVLPQKLASAPKGELCTTWYKPCTNSSVMICFPRSNIALIYLELADPEARNRAWNLPGTFRSAAYRQVNLCGD